MVILAAPSLLLLMVGFRLFVSTGRDDAHITYWPAYTLAHFGQMLNYNGERVEQSSSLLHVLVLAILNKLTGVDVVTLGKVSSIAGGAGTLLVVYAVVRKIADRAVAFAGAMLAAASAYFIYWSFGGLETTLVSLTGATLVLTCGNYLTGPSSRIAGPLLAALAFAMVRPESPLVLVVLTTFAAVLAVFGRLGSGDARVVRTRALLLVGAAVAIFGSLVAFRVAYFGSAFPQPVVAKYVGLTRTSLVSGYHYLASATLGAGAGITAALLTAAAACVSLAIDELRAKRGNPHMALALAFVAVYVAFTFTSGGDWMEGGRFLVFFLPLALALIPVAVARSFTREMSSRIAVAFIATLLVLLEAGSLVSFARTESVGTLNWQNLEIAKQHNVSGYSWFEKRNRVNMRDVPIIDFLRDLIPDIQAVKPGPVVLMTGQMGMIPYHVAQKFRGDILLIDRRGLCDRMLTRCEYSHTLFRDARGLHMEYIDFFHDQKKIDEQCGLPHPDVVFDLRGGNTQIVAENGYTIVARQFGEVRDALGEGGEVQATGFVALRNDLWEAIAAADSIQAKEPR